MLHSKREVVSQVMHGLALSIALAPPYLLAQPIAPAERLVELLSQVESMEAEVTQLVLDQSGRELQESRVELLMRKPDHFYWHTVEPYEELMLTDGETLWIHEPDLEQLTIQDFNADLGRTPALLLSEDAETLHASFDIERQEINGRESFTLLPRDPGSLFEILTLNFHQGSLEDMHFEDSLGQKTHLAFEILAVNQPVDEGRFSFEPPEGVDVIDSRRE